MAAASSPLSPMSTTAVCLASAFSKRMSDLFLLPCVVSPSPSPTPLLPPAPFLASVHTLRLSHSGCPGPPPLLSPLQCLHMQSLSECAMSFLLGSASSFTVDWFLFRSRGNGPPPPSPSFPLPPPPPFLPPGQANGVGNGPDVRCMVDGSAALAPRVPAAGRGPGGPGPPLLIPLFRFVLGRWGGREAQPPPGAAERQSQRLREGGGLPHPSPPGKAVAQRSPPPPRPPDAHRRPHALRRLSS